MKKIILPILVVVIIFTVGCTNNKLQPKKSGEVDEADQSIATVEQTVFSVGDIIEIGDEKLIVHGVNDYQESYEWLAPEPGKKYVAVEVSLENIGTGDINYHPEEFQLKDDQGYSFNISYIGKRTPSFDPGTLTSGQTVRGYITFQVLNDAGPLELNFKPKWWNAGQVTIKLWKHDVANFRRDRFETRPYLFIFLYNKTKR